MGGCILSFGVNGSEAATLSLTCSEGRLPADWALVKGEGAATRCSWWAPGIAPAAEAPCSSWRRTCVAVGHARAEWVREAKYTRVVFAAAPKVVSVAPSIVARGIVIVGSNVERAGLAVAERGLE